MTELERKTPEAGQASGGTFDNGQDQYSTAEQKLTTNSAAYPYYNSVEDSAPAKVLSLAQLAWLATGGPTVGPKTQAAALTPFRADGKRKEQAVNALFYGLITDHDDDNKSADEIRASYGRWSVAYLAYTTASHEQEKKWIVGKRWKPLIPFSCPTDYERYKILSNGLMLLNGTDAAQSRSQQVFFAPNVIEEGAPFDYIDETDRPFLNPHDDSHPLVKACLQAYEADTERKEKQASQAAPKPRPANVSAANAGIIDKVKAAYTGAEPQILEQFGYKRIGRRYLSPWSSTGTPGVMILDSGKVYSHHGETDPLSSLNHDGHALDVFDLLCIFRFDNDFSRAVAELADEVDPEGQKQRQREHMAAKDDPVADIRALFEKPAEEPEDAAPERPKSDGIDLLKPPGLAGEICRFMELNARRSSPDLYPLAALHLIALVGRERRSVYTDKLNLITLSIAPTAAGKENTQDAVKRLAREHYCSKLIHGNAGSFKELIVNLLDGHGASLYVVDEIHSLLGSMKDKNAATYETKMEAEILTMSSTKLYTFRGMEKRSVMDAYTKELSRIEKKLEESEGEEAEKLNRVLSKVKERIDWLENGLPDPFFSLMGHSVPSRLDSFIRTDNIDSGFLGRTLVARGADTRAKLRRTPVDEHALALCEFNISNGLTDVRRSASTVGVNDDAADYLDKCIDWYDQDEQLNHHVAGGIYARAPEHLYRVATILALETGTITLEHARYADALVKHSIDNISYILLKAYAESDGAQEKQVIEHARQTIHRNCKGTGLPPSRIKDLVTRPTGWQEMQTKDVKRDRFAELIDTMLANDELELQEDGRRKRYLSRSCV